MLRPVVLIVLAVVSLASWSSWRTRNQLLLRIRSEWGRARKRQRDMEGIADFFRSRDDAAGFDDRTWSDLLLDDVFAHLDRTQSTVGQQLLYNRLRSAAGSLDDFEAIVERAGKDVDGREKAQASLARLNDPSGYNLHRLTRPDALDRKWRHALFPLWGGAVFVTLLLSILWPKLLITALIAIPVNFVIRISTARRIGMQVAWFRQVGPLLSAASSLAAMDTFASAGITGSLKADLHALKRLGTVARWVSRDPATTNDIVFSAMEYLNVLFLLDANALYFASRDLQARAPQFRRTIETVGEIDAAIAVASFRTELREWTQPGFTTPDARATFANLRHPLVQNAVPNSVTLAPPQGLLITGSNMSGKSTFLRTVGINVVLAQTINTCLAERYEAPIYQVRSCIGRADDLLARKSYYLVEVESVLALVRASDSPEPHLFIFDELFRGTNAVERIAAAEAVLDAIIGRGKPHVALVATHDGELVDLLRESYEVCHFGDELGPEGLTFNYCLTPGPATSRNAIALLKLNGAPESLVRRALERAAELDRLRESVR